MLRFISAIVAITGAAAPAIAQPRQPAIAYTGPASGDLATSVRERLQGFAQRRGLGLADLAKPAPPPSRAKELLASGIEAYHAFKYPEALAALERALAEVEASGGADLDRRELADLFLYRALSATETGAVEVARDNLVRAATVHPTYPIDKARFRPSLVASYERARAAVRATAAAEVELDLPDGCAVRVDGGDASGVKAHSLRPGRHFIRARCPGRLPLAASPTFAAGKQRFAPTLQPVAGDRERVLSATAPAERIVWVALADNGEVAVSLIDRRSDKALRRWALRVDSPSSVAKLDGVMASIIDQEFAAPAPDPVIVEKPPPPRRWYQKPWVWVAIGAVGASAIAVPIVILRSGDPSGFDAPVDFGGPAVIRALICGAVLVAGCNDRPELRIVIDMPPDASPAFPFAGDIIDSLSLSIISPDGSGEFTTREPDEELSIDNIPFGRGLVVEVSGDSGDTQTAFGRSCPFDYDKDLGGPVELHVYFSRVRRWGVGPPALVPDRVGGHAYTRRSGDVFIAGGVAGGVLERFDPRSGTFATVDNAPASLARNGSVLARIGDDGAIIVGGTDGNDEPITQVETLPDLRDSLSDGPPLRSHAATELFGGRALIVGGEQFAGGQFTVVGDAREYELAAGTAVTPSGPIPGLANPRAGHSATSLFEELGVAVLIAGGRDAAGAAVTVTEVYRPLSQTFENLPGTLDRHGHQAIRLDGNFVLIVGGFLGDGSPARELALFDPVQGTFTAAGQLPDAAAITGFAATTMSDGRVMLTGGRDENGDIVAAAHLASLDAFDGNVTISETNFLSVPRTGHIGVELCDRSLMLVGGESIDGATPPTERYVPGL